MRSLLITLILLLAGTAFANDHFPPGHVDRMRGMTPIPEDTRTQPLVNPDEADGRPVRNYAMQPPVIPHRIDNYQIDRSANRCMFCHARTRTGASQAPMISVTHFMNRDGNFLAELSPRRYFCLQCHVPQVDNTPLVDNEFIDVETILRRSGSPSTLPAN